MNAGPDQSTDKGNRPLRARPEDRVYDVHQSNKRTTRTDSASVHHERLSRNEARRGEGNDACLPGPGTELTVSRNHALALFKSLYTF